MLSAEDEHTEAIIECFSRRGITCAVIGETDASGRLRLADADSKELLWDLHAEPLTGCGMELKQ